MTDAAPEDRGWPLIYRQMGRVLADIPAVPKSEKNSQQGYAVQGIDDIIDALHPALAAHGVFLVPLVIERIAEQRQTRSNSTLWTVHLLVEFRFCAEDGSYVSALTWGEGTDAGDKATSKAHTMALKAALRQVFAIAEGTADPDTQTAPESGPPIDVDEEFRRMGWADRDAANEVRTRQMRAIKDHALAPSFSKWRQSDQVTIGAFSEGWHTAEEAARIDAWLTGVIPQEQAAEGGAEDATETPPEAPEKPAKPPRGKKASEAEPPAESAPEPCAHDWFEQDNGDLVCPACGEVQSVETVAGP